MHAIDYGIIIVFLFALPGIGFYLSRRAGKDTDEYILAGRKMPWWLADCFDLEEQVVCNRKKENKT